MIKLLKNIFIFSLLCLVTLFVTERLLVKRSQFTDHNSKKYGEIYNNSNRHDLIIIGASHGFYGINPRKMEYLNVNAFNHCLDGSNPSFTLKWLKDVYLKNNKLPKIVLYEVNWFMFDDKWLWRRIENDSMYLNHNDFFSFFIDNKIDKVLLLRNRYKIFQNECIFEQFWQKNIDGIVGVLNDQYYKGYVPHELNIYNASRDRFHGNSNNQIADFKKIIELIKKNGSKLILVESPEYMNSYNRRHFMYNKIIKTIASEYNLNFLNYNEGSISDINYSKKLYYDYGHLNREGGNIFSEILARDLSGIISN